MKRTVHALAILLALVCLSTRGVAQDNPAGDARGSIPPSLGQEDSGYGPLPVDQLPLYFAGAKLAKLYGLNLDLTNAKFADAFMWALRNYAATVSSKKAGGLGFAYTPLVGQGEYSVEATLGFLTVAGLTASSFTGIEIDLFNSNPLIFYFLGVFWANNQLWAFAQNENGPIGPPVPLGQTLMARIRIVQTASTIAFYARAYKATQWLLVGSIAALPFTGMFQVGFGANNLGAGSAALIDQVVAWGALFGPVVLPYLITLQAYFSDLSAIYCAMLIQNDLAAALNILSALLPLIDGTRDSVNSAGRAGDFLSFVLWSSAVKFLSSAYKTGMKLQSSLERGDILKALPLYFSMWVYLQLADLSLRGMRVKKEDDLRYFRRFRPEVIATDSFGTPWAGPIPVPPLLGAGGIRG